MYTYELNDLLFFTESLKSPSPHSDINQYIQFSNHSTRATSAHKLTHSFSFTSRAHQHSFFSMIIRLWNSVPVIDLSLPTDTIKKHLSGKSLVLILLRTTHAHFILCGICTVFNYFSCCIAKEEQPTYQKMHMQLI